MVEEDGYVREKQGELFRQALSSRKDDSVDTAYHFSVVQSWRGACVGSMQSKQQANKVTWGAQERAGGGGGARTYKNNPIFESTVG